MFPTKQLRILFYTLTAVVLSIVIYFLPASSPTLQNLVFISVCLLLTAQVLLKTTGILNIINSIIKTLKSKRSIKNSSILVVDDNIGNRKVMVEMLSTLSLTTSLTTAEAHNGKQALNLFKHHKFKLIFMDIEMHGMNGLETVKAIRLFENGQQRIPIVAVSAHTNPEKIHQALIAGYDDYLSKPIDDKKLTDSLNRWLYINDTLEETSLLKEAAPPASTTSSNINRSNVDNCDVNVDEDIEDINKVVDIKESLSRSRNNPELAKDMLTMLIDLIIKERNNMVKLFENADWKSLGQLAHKLNGGSCYCGVTTLQKYAEAVDKAIDQQQIDEAKSNFPKLLKAMDELTDWNNQHDLDIIFS